VGLPDGLVRLHHGLVQLPHGLVQLPHCRVQVQAALIQEPPAASEILTQITGAPPPAGNSALAGYAAEYEQTHHVIYIDSNSNIQELYRSGNSWANTTLSVSAGSGATPPLSTASPLAGYAFERERTQHVYYLDANLHVHELYRSGNAWHAGEVSP
jgi:hypothetical protein